MDKRISKNEEVNKTIVQDDQTKQKREKELLKQIAELKKVIQQKEEERPDTNIARGDSREPHALLLDFSLGKPLWDDPVGAITRVDPKAKEVTINIGSARGVKPDLTFNVFAPSKYLATRGEKQLKGTIEVIRVLGPNTSIARITSVFTDLEARERGEDRQMEFHDGDLLYNLFWGTRVAVTGYPNVTGV